MNDFYVEQIVKRKVTSSDNFLGALIIVAAGLAAYGAITKSYLFWILVVLFIVAGAVHLINITAEYEYFYMNGTLRIDKIYAKRFRECVFEIQIDDLEVLVPDGAAEVQLYRSVRSKKYISKGDKQKYELIYTQFGKKRSIIFEPNEMLLTELKKLAPKKVFRKR